MTVRMTLPDRATRSQMLNSGMERGMEASYRRFESMTPVGLDASRGVPQ
jgi:hypothetical protein